MLPLIFILPIVLVLLLRIAEVRHTESIEERSDTVISETQTVRAEVIGMQSALRAYLLTGNPAFKQDFASRERLVDATLAAIGEDAAGDPAMTARVSRLAPHTRAWMAYASAVMARSRTSQREGAGIGGDETYMAPVTRDVGAILAAKSSERGRVISRAEHGIRTLLLIVVVCALLATLATALSVRRMLILAEIERQAEQERARLREARRRTAELERENHRFKTADKFKSEYLATMSHELRTPLTAMLGFSEVIRDGKVGPITPEQADCLDHIVKSGHHLLELVGSVLDLAKVEAGKLDVAMIVSDPRLPVRDVVDGMRELAARKSLRLELDLATSPREALVDPSRLRQILYNYLSNAIKFTPAGGTVRVRLLPEGSDGFRLEVADSGIGIADADVKTLFKEFGQIASHETAAQKGTGLGLALTKRLTEAQGGYVGVKSTLGAGSTFFAVFPQAVWAAGSQRKPRETALA
ncbi:MAG TPA: ATP-binding protein [Candidatus Tumulicola sp.]|nr:ATP-binding protein [Candidatus Tumulicola sp.]